MLLLFLSHPKRFYHHYALKDHCVVEDVVDLDVDVDVDVDDVVVNITAATNYIFCDETNPILF